MSTKATTTARAEAPVPTGANQTLGSLAAEFAVMGSPGPEGEADSDPTIVEDPSDSSETNTDANETPTKPPSEDGNAPDGAVETEPDDPSDESDSSDPSDELETESEEPEPDPEPDPEPESTEEPPLSYNEQFEQLRSEMLEAIEEAALPGGHGKMVKRIHKLTDQREKANRRVEELEGEVAELSARTPATASPGNGMDFTAFDPRMQQLNLDRQQHEQVLGAVPKFLQQLEDTGEDELRLPGQDGKEIVLTRDQIEQRRDEAKDAITDLRLDQKVLRRELEQKFAAEAEAFNARAKELYPWTADPQAAEWKQVAPFLELFPELQQRAPGFKLIIGGLHQLQAQWAEPAAEAKVKVPVKKVHGRSAPTPQPSTPPAQPRKGKVDRLAAAREKTRQTGTRQALAEEFAVGMAG